MRLATAYSTCPSWLDKSPGKLGVARYIELPGAARCVRTDELRARAERGAVGHRHRHALVLICPGRTSEGRSQTHVDPAMRTRPSARPA